MAKEFSLTIACDNAAYGDTPEECGEEIARQLQIIASHIKSGRALIENESGRSWDRNGNATASWQFDGADEFEEDEEDEEEDEE